MIRFIRWWWKDRIDIFGKFVVLLISDVFLAIIIGFIYGFMTGFVWMYIGFAAIAVLALLRLAVKYFIKEIQKYKKEQEHESEQIVEILKNGKY